MLTLLLALPKSFVFTWEISLVEWREVDLLINLTWFKVYPFIYIYIYKKKKIKKKKDFLMFKHPLVSLLRQPLLYLQGKTMFKVLPPQKKKKKKNPRLIWFRFSSD
jgi:hypothetical protein